MNKQIIKSLVGTVIGLGMVSSTAFAGYLFHGQHDHQDHHSHNGFCASHSNFVTLGGGAWDPGTDTVRYSGAPAPVVPAAPGAATWSRMESGVSAGIDALHGANVTSDFTALLGQTGAQADAYINAALDIWADASGFTNLGKVTDSGAAFGASNADGGHIGDIRIGAIFIDGSGALNVLAHAFSPCTNGVCGPNGSLGGDVHIDNGNNWVDNPDSVGFDLDLFSVLLHELGHALGLGHSDVPGSVMEAVYAGARRSLTADDIAGIQAIYGAPVVVPLPGALVLFLSGLSAFGLFGRSKKQL